MQYYILKYIKKEAKWLVKPCKYTATDTATTTNEVELWNVEYDTFFYLPLKLYKYNLYLNISKILR